MGLFDFLKKGRKPQGDERYMTYTVSYDPPGQHMEILCNSMDICMKTVNPDTFFSREKLASNEALYCKSEERIVWNGMTCAQIYDMLNDSAKKAAWHRQFIDRLFERGREDNLTYQMYDAVLSKECIDYFVKRLNGKKYHFCRVGFADSNRLYTYVTKDRSIKVGDSVTIPTGNGFVPDSKLKQVVEVFDASLDELDFPVDMLRCIEEKLRSIVCPHCGASIEIDVGAKTGRCTRCQTEFYLIDMESGGGNEYKAVPLPENEQKQEVKIATKPPVITENSTKPEPENVPTVNEPEEVKEPEVEEEKQVESTPAEEGTYSWERFYPEHVSDKTVELMTKEGLRLVQGKGIKPGDLADALTEIEKSKNRLKILNDLKDDNYQVHEKDILEIFRMDGDSPVLNEMIKMYTGTFSKEVLVEFYTCGTDIKLSEMLKRVPGDLNFTEREILEILNSVNDSDVAGIKALLERYNPKSIKKETVVEICEILPLSATSAAKKYLKLLPAADRIEIQEDFF